MLSWNVTPVTEEGPLYFTSPAVIIRKSSKLNWIWIVFSSQLYMDGALSNNMPLFEQRNTITVAPFSGESDICPREGTFNFFEVHYGNVSIQVNTGNVHRICTSFLPTTLQVGSPSHAAVCCCCCCLWLCCDAVCSYDRNSLRFVATATWMLSVS